MNEKWQKGSLFIEKTRKRNEKQKDFCLKIFAIHL